VAETRRHSSRASISSASYRLCAPGVGSLVSMLLLWPSLPLQADPPTHARWETTFNDEFDGEALSLELWESQASIRGGHRLEGRWPENNVVKDGLLHQVTKKEDPPRGGKQWSTAHIWTRDFTQQYGYFEARLRYGRYLNNAFWLYRPWGRYPERPHFEIDINEGHTPREVAMTLHYYVYPEWLDQAELHSTGKRWEAATDLDEDFHVYGVEWNEELVIWYFDGEPVRVLENPKCHAPADVRLSTVIMQHHLKRDGVSLDVMDGVSMDVDWVRVYRKTADLYAPDLPPSERHELPKAVKRDRQVAPAQRRTVLFEEDFESAQVGALPPGWEVGDLGPAVAADDAEGGKPVLAPDNKVLKLEAGEYVFRMFEAPVEGRLEVELDCYVPSGQPGLLFVTLGDFEKNDPERRKTSYYTGDIGPYIHWIQGFLSYYTEEAKWTHFAQWKYGLWGQARFVLDISRGVFDYYGGEDTADSESGGLFRHAQRAAKGIGLRHRGQGAPVYVDNIVVSKLD